ncbi:hypothetical protein DICPUDRAFT_96768 [Dictyostelium purpureum]|uniref:Glutamate--cysteine ligase n=1 Tax=Dictyostelium purpureum TaxID=5786 RepID=F0ZB11_DICPU|nr:uncharacterized protein DICPUDRAFT_96768 [Dictyostelium purpureum]EGC38811.1 hypothetical protein DICPUDRAFT_96768 [Dictyostelium purpureum]|eukprot:XP_003284605.1 hypothetical protein DICPUDRAFT_96768 [Dictyostelium purpureum]
MGFIAEGNTLAWEDAEQHANYIREHGIIQLLNILKSNKDRHGDDFKWGDEVEYILITNDTFKLKLRANEVLDLLMLEEKRNHGNVDHLWRPEYGRFMIEGTPGSPYEGLGRQLLAIQQSLVKRRESVQRYLKPEESILTVTCYPRMGCKGFTEPQAEVKGPVAESQFLPDMVINPHFRFSTLTANIRKRRGSNVSINIPMFKDTFTKEYVDQQTYISPDQDDKAINQPYNIYMDAMGFGMGCCCLQATFQLPDMEEARNMFDQLAPITPLVLSLSAASSIFKGYLSDIDARWTVISQSVDDRTKEELGKIGLNKNKFVINKSRYDSIDCYISRSPQFRSEYNDLDLVYDKDVYQKMVENGIDGLLSKHFAHLFIRDPLVIYSDKIEIDDEKHTDHFENIQSTNWQTVRFKPPPPGASIGWRVELRSMEVQLTDFQNAAFIVFSAILVKAIADLKLNFYVPISKIDENLKTAHKRNSVVNDKFYFRKNIYNNNSPNGSVENEYELMTINEIFNGKGEFIGLVNVLKNYIKSLNFDAETNQTVNRYLNFISQKASGEIKTISTWTREFVQNHPAYKHDSVVSEEIQADYLKLCLDITNGVVYDEEIQGNFERLDSN